MSKRVELPVALTIAGSDSGGGAGLQADLRAFAAFKVHGATAVTCVTAQNPKAVTAIHPVPVAMVRAQIESVLAELPPRAAKTGMMFSREIIEAVVEMLKGAKFPLVVDPVMISTSGRRLLEIDAICALCDELLPLARLVTPNKDEAEVLAGFPIANEEEARDAAKAIFEEFGCAALVKGGHLRGATESADFYYDGKAELMLTAPYRKGLKTHGTGCVFSAAITAALAQGKDLPRAVEAGKNHITRAIHECGFAAGHPVLGPLVG